MAYSHIRENVIAYIQLIENNVALAQYKLLSVAYYWIPVIFLSNKMLLIISFISEMLLSIL